ncbi:MAG: hypothetical protein ACI9KN_001449 [Gammaproteobacteria bacterium]|jgi:hypothetical protein
MSYNVIRLFASIVFIHFLFPNAAFGASLSIAQTENSSPNTSPVQQKSRLIDLWQPGDPGQRMNIRGRVMSIDGTPLGGITILIR